MRRFLADLWSPPTGLSRRLQLEWRLVAIRWIGIVLVGLALPLTGLSSERLAYAYGILTAGGIYNQFILALLRGNSPPVRLGYFTAMGDALLNSTMMLVFGGGFDSPFAYFLFSVVVATAMRFGYLASVAAVVAFTLLDLVQRAWEGTGVGGAFLFRAGFLALVALLASYLRERADRDEAILQQRLDELEQAYADLASAHQELQGLDEVKSTLIANISHEFRTPLTSIRGFSEMLLTYDDPATQKEFLGIINSESERLTRLADEVLDLARIESGQVEWRREPVEVGALLEAAARIHRPIAESHGLTLDVAIPGGLPVVEGDRDRLQQVLDNVLSNAIKFTARGGIHLTACRVEGGVELHVSDTGTGIASEDQARIFEKFQQVGPVLTDKPKGTGLGLAISRDIVQQHDGRLVVESRLGEGSVFKVFLPTPRPG